MESDNFKCQTINILIQQLLVLMNTEEKSRVNEVSKLLNGNNLDGKQHLKKTQQNAPPFWMVNYNKM